MQVCFALVDVGQWVVEIIFLLDLLNNFMAEGQVECFLRAETSHISCSLIKLIRILNESLSQPKNLLSSPSLYPLSIYHMPNLVVLMVEK
jgi:hypothetical protein